MNCKNCGARLNFHQLSGVYSCPDCGQVVIPDDVSQAMQEANYLATCRLALVFYGDEANYREPFAVLGDGGQLARAALSGLEGSSG